MEFENLLQLGRKGSALLFCGAGFSADCLSFASDETIGAGARLTALLNTKLAELGEPSGYAKLQNVGDAASLAMG